jgi:7,8-dihydro-6-hydroxymethylpterin-pyrophosphokinase
MAIFYLSLGSNIHPEENLKLARKFLKKKFLSTERIKNL